jgi:hypothetical protein
MWPRLKLVLLKRLRLMETWIIFFILGFIMMNYPFISIFNKPVTLAGTPLLFLYLQIGWLASIIVIYLFVKAADLRQEEESDKGAKR